MAEAYLVPEREGDAVLRQSFDLMPPAVWDVDEISGPHLCLKSVQISKARESFVIRVLQLNLKVKIGF